MKLPKVMCQLTVGSNLQGHSSDTVQPFSAQLCVGDDDTASESLQWLLVGWGWRGEMPKDSSTAVRQVGEALKQAEHTMKQIDMRRGPQRVGEPSGSALTPSSPSTAQCHPVLLPQLVTVALRNESCFSTSRVLTLHTSGRFTVVIK